MSSCAAPHEVDDLLKATPPPTSPPGQANGDAPCCRRREDETEDDDDMERRLTAAEELRGHLLDCVSLYASRFAFVEASLTCIGPLCHGEEGGSDVQAASQAAEDVSCLSNTGNGAFDAAVVATVVFVRVEAPPSPPRSPPPSISAADSGVSGAAAAATGSEECAAPLSPATVLVGVVVKFQYWRGFTRVAERRYGASRATTTPDATAAAGATASRTPEDRQETEAAADAAALAGGRVTLAELLRDSRWHAVADAEPVDSGECSGVGSQRDAMPLSPATPPCTPPSPALRRSPYPSGEAGAGAYESLMALLVNTYL